jgi:hypothetical protein
MQVAALLIDVSVDHRLIARTNAQIALLRAEQPETLPAA